MTGEQVIQHRGGISYFHAELAQSPSNGPQQVVVAHEHGLWQARQGVKIRLCGPPRMGPSNTSGKEDLSDIVTMKKMRRGFESSQRKGLSGSVLRRSGAEELARTAGIDLDASYAYGNHQSDIPLLETVGHPVAVEPSPLLRERAQAEGWRILSYR